MDDQDPPSPYAGAYLPSHTTADVALGKSFGERYTVSLNLLNVGNTRVLLDNSLTFGGFHYNDPREIYGEVRYRFKVLREVSCFLFGRDDSQNPRNRRAQLTDEIKYGTGEGGS